MLSTENYNNNTKNRLLMKPYLIGIMLILATFISGCISSGENISLSIFEEEKNISGKVIENNNVCVVDLVCYLTIEFSDKTVNALYGTGERPAPPCEISREVSNVAFDVKQGDIIDVVISNCGSDAYYIKQIGYP